MMNRIKQFALFALLLVPAMAQASERSLSESVVAAGLVTPSRASAKAADRKHSAEKHYDQYGREIIKTEAINSWKTLLAERKASKNQLISKKKTKPVNCLSAWYNSNKMLAGAIVGATIWGGTTALSGYAEGRDTASIAQGCAVPAFIGSCTGAIAGASGNLGKYAVGSAIGGATGYLQGRYTDATYETVATSAYGFAGNVVGAFLGTRLENTSSAASCSVGAVVGYAYGYGTAFAPVALPALAGAFIGDYCGFYNQKKPVTAEIAVQTEVIHRYEDTLASQVKF